MRNRKCIVVLGLHRSGTSALTRVLKKCGVYLGDTKKPSIDGQKENFENVRVSEFNTNMLAKYNYIWSDLVPEMKFDDEDIRALKDVINKEFSNQDLFAIKEPGLVYLFPLYERVFKDLGIEINFLILYRNPLEVAQALVNRNGFTEYKGVFLWLYNFLLGEKYSREYIRGLVNFEDLINDTGSVINQIGKIVSISIDEQRKLDGLLKSRFKRHVLEDELKKYSDLWLPTIVGQIKHFGDNSQTRLYDSIMQHIAEKIDFIDQIQANHTDFWHTQSESLKDAIIKLRIQWQLKDENLQIKEQDLATQQQEFNVRDKVLASREENLSQEYDRINAKEEDIINRENELSSKAQELTQSLEQLEILKTSLEAKDSELVAKDTMLSDKEKTIDESEREFLSQFNVFKEKSEEIEKLSASLKTKEDELLSLEKKLADKEAQFSSLSKEIGDKANQLHNKEHELSIKSKELEDKANQLNLQEVELNSRVAMIEEEEKKGFFAKVFGK